MHPDYITACPGHRILLPSRLNYTVINSTEVPPGQQIQFPVLQELTGEKLHLTTASIRMQSFWMQLLRDRYPKQKGATAFCLHLEHKEVRSSFLPKWCPHQLKKLSAVSKLSPTYIITSLKANLYFALQLYSPLIHYFAWYYKGALATKLEAFSIFI